MSIMAIFSIVVMMLAITGCAPKQTAVPNITLETAVIGEDNNTIQSNITELKSSDNNSPTMTAANPEVSEVPKTTETQNVSYTLTATEGDLVTLKLKAVDPDGLPLKYNYGTPFNDQGLWQTEDGDAGKYLVRVSAEDEFSTTSADVLVIINSRNKAPIIDCPDEVTVKEGETVNLDCSFFDKENDPITTEYTGWMTSTSYTTNFESSGDHKVQVRAADLNNSALKTIVIHVENVPRAPIFDEHLKDITITEGDIVTLKPKVSEPDVGEKITLTYSEPFDTDGVWKTKLDDAGVYPVSVVATSQGLSTKESFTLTVKMLTTPPVMALIPNITVSEGETVKFAPEAKDRQNNPIIITYSGWMTEAEKTTTFDDAYPNGCNKAGCSITYKVVVSASNGVYNVSQDVYVTVVDKNRAPVFVWPTQ
jgi:hypothetical protein